MPNQIGEWAGVAQVCWGGSWQSSGAAGTMIVANSLNAPSNTNPTVSIACPNYAGGASKIVGGGGACNGIAASLAMWANQPWGQGWLVGCRALESYTVNVSVYAICQPM